MTCLRLAAGCLLFASTGVCAGDPPAFRLGFSGPAKVIQLGDFDVRVFAFVELTGLDASGPGAQGWTIDVASEGCELVWASTNETEAAPANIGGRRSGGFERTELVRVGGATHAISSVALSSAGSVTLEPVRGHAILQLALETPRRAGEPCERCVLVHASRSDPRAPVIVRGGDEVEPEVEGAAYDLCRVPFRRGDANADGRVDISDAIRTLMYLFLNGKDLACLDAADVDDSGDLDLTDAVYLLEDLFRPDSSIPPPGAFGCAPDPTPERLNCDGFSGC